MATKYNTGNPVGSADPRDLNDNAVNIDEWATSRTKETHPDRLGVSRRTWYGMESDFDASQSDRAQRFDASQSDRAQRFDASQSDRAQRFDASQGARELEFQQQLVENGYQELGEYAAGIVIENLNQVVTVGDYMYRLSPTVLRPYTTSGNWQNDSSDFIQIDFVTASQLQAERDQRASADSSLQQQITEAAPIAAAERPIVQWHSQVIENSLTIPADVNAFSFGPEITIAAGQEVTVSAGSSWTIANGSVQQ